MQDEHGHLRRRAARAPMLAADTERELLAQIRDHDDPKAMAALLDSHLRLVLAMAHRYTRHGVSLEDLVAEGNLGLVEAARRFEADRGTRFSTYAAWWVRALIRRYALANRRIVPAPSTRNARKLIGTLRTTERKLSAELGRAPTPTEVAEALGVEVKDVEMVDTALRARDVSFGPRPDGTDFELASPKASPEQQVADHQLAARSKQSVHRALDLLDAREREIVEKRFLEEDRQTLSNIGSTMGLSRERVRQLEVRAREKLRVALLNQVA